MLKNNKIFKTSDLQKLDKYTIENEPVTSLDLMERAATVFTEKLLIFSPIVIFLTFWPVPEITGETGMSWQDCYIKTD